MFEFRDGPPTNRIPNTMVIWIPQIPLSLDLGTSDFDFGSKRLQTALPTSSEMDT
jgi:hypothetical protein